jgi:hypothetical protein
MGTLMLHALTALSDHVQETAGTAWGLVTGTCVFWLFTFPLKMNHDLSKTSASFYISCSAFILSVSYAPLFCVLLLYMVQLSTNTFYKNYTYIPSMMHTAKLLQMLCCSSGQNSQMN